MTSKVDSREVSLVAGYNLINYFLGARALRQSGLEVLEDRDITRETAPNLDIVDQMGRDLIMPTFKLISYTLDQNYPWLARLLRWKYDKKIKKINRKYLSGERNSESFARSKVYRLLLLKKPEN